MLEGVVISGGEPTIQRDLEGFVKSVKDMDYLVKLDTNGHNPHVIQRLIDLLEYVAMDVKAPLNKYEEVVSAKADVKRKEESIRLIIRWGERASLGGEPSSDWRPYKRGKQVIIPAGPLIAVGHAFKALP